MIFPSCFASAKEGWASENSDVRGDDMACLFDKVVDCVPFPDVDADGPFRMLVTTLESDPYLGRVLTGRIQSGSLTANTTVQALNRNGGMVEKARVTKVQAFRGPARTEVATACAGDIVSIAGFSAATVADTLCDVGVSAPISADPVDPPTLAMVFSINDSPMAGRDGDKMTSRVIRTRLMAEAEGNVAIRNPRNRGRQRLRGGGPRRVAIGRFDRDHAPRRVRTVHQPAPGADPRGSGHRADSGAL